MAIPKNMMMLPAELIDRAAIRLSNVGATDISEDLFVRLQAHMESPVLSDADALQLAQDYPAYWKKLPAHWEAIDTYRVDDLFPLPSSRLYHTRKKLLVPGCRTGGKTIYQDLKEAHRTLGAWLAEQPEHSQ